MEVLPLLAQILLLGTAFAQQRCVSRNYGNGGTVCVCNATYCDTVARPQQIARPFYYLYTSNLAGLRFQQSNGTFYVPNDSISDIYIDSSTQYQSIIGFGGAFTDSTGFNLRTLPQRTQESILRAYFSEDGIEYNMGRVPIGGTDFSLRAYTYDDGPEDPELRNFNLTSYDFNYKIPYIRRARNISNGTMLLFCSAWSAPRWMKTNDQYAGFGFIRQSMYETWAQYYLRFLEAYQNEGINFWGVTTGNEPADALYPFDRLEVNGWPSWDLATWIAQNLGPTLRNSNFSDIQIMVLDDQRIFLPWYVQRVFNNRRAREYVNGIAVHWYLDQYVPPSVLEQTHNRFPYKFILATEASIVPTGGEPAVLLGSWRRGEDYSFDIIQDLQNWVTGWIDWNMALDPNGGPNYIRNFVDAPIIINSTSGEFYKQPLYYHLGHFSKFLTRGSVRIPTTVNAGLNIDVVCFQRPDRARVLIILNRNNKDIPVVVTDAQRGTINVAVTPRSINTVLFW